MKCPECGSEGLRLTIERSGRGKTIKDENNNTKIICTKVSLEQLGDTFCDNCNYKLDLRKDFKGGCDYEE